MQTLQEGTLFFYYCSGIFKDRPALLRIPSNNNVFLAPALGTRATRHKLALPPAWHWQRGSAMAVAGQQSRPWAEVAQRGPGVGGPTPNPPLHSTYLCSIPT
jgi:hypothetical protein